MADQDHREPVSEVRPRKCANPFIGVVPCLVRIEVDFGLDHGMLLEGRQGFIEPSGQESEVDVVSRRCWRQQDFHFRGLAKLRIIAQAHLAIDPTGDAFTVFLLLVPVPRECEVRMLFSYVVQERVELPRAGDFLAALRFFAGEVAMFSILLRRRVSQPLA